jgi:hypothetical protein
MKLSAWEQVIEDIKREEQRAKEARRVKELKERRKAWRKNHGRMD